MHSEYDSPESIADWDLEDGEPRKILASPLSNANRNGKPAALLQERGASAKSAQADLRKGLMPSSSQEPRAFGKPDAMFSSGSKEPVKPTQEFYFLTS